MNKILPILLISSAIFLGSCSGINCDQLPKTYSSYDAAIKSIKAAHFKIQETVNTSKSSWVRGASYYSCDKKIGYFIIKTDKRNYIYKDLPINIWNDFKNASSFGSYYNRNIKNRYQLYLTN